MVLSVVLNQLLVPVMGEVVSFQSRGKESGIVWPQRNPSHTLQITLVFSRTLILTPLLTSNLIFEVLAELLLLQGSLLRFCKTEGGLPCVHMMACTPHIPVCGDHLSRTIIQF